MSPTDNRPSCINVINLQYQYFTICARWAPIKCVNINTPKFRKFCVIIIIDACMHACIRAGKSFRRTTIVASAPTCVWLHIAYQTNSQFAAWNSHHKCHPVGRLDENVAALGRYAGMESLSTSSSPSSSMLFLLLCTQAMCAMCGAFRVFGLARECNMHKM